MRRDTASKMLVYRWDNIQNYILSSLHTMLETEDAMVKYSLTIVSSHECLFQVNNVTIIGNGGKVRAHQFVLQAASPFFR